jgi:hypothetical protein
MKTQIWLGFACSFSLLNSLTLPAMAQGVSPQSSTTPQSLQSVQINQPTATPQALTIDQSTAIVISFPAPLAIDVGQNQDYPLTVPLAQAIYDNQGNVIVPENTPVSILLKPTDGGAKIVAQSIVVKGRIVSLQASSPMIPGTTIVQKRANDKALENGAIFGRLGGSLGGVFSSGDPDKFDLGAMGGSALGIITGLRSAEDTRVVQIPQGSVYVLSLEAPIQISLR